VRRDGGMLVRLGKDNDAWALKIPGIALMVMQGRKMSGWVRAAPHVHGDDALRRKLLKAALEFTGLYQGNSPAPGPPAQCVG
jgi:hypothetical protein